MFCLSKHLGTSETMFFELIRVCLSHFQGRAGFWETNNEINLSEVKRLSTCISQITARAIFVLGPGCPSWRLNCANPHPARGMTPIGQMLVHRVHLSQVVCPSTDPQLVTDNVSHHYEITYVAYIQAKEGHFDGAIIDAVCGKTTIWY